MSTDTAPDDALLDVAKKRGLVPDEDPVVAVARKRGLIPPPQDIFPKQRGLVVDRTEDPVVQVARKRGLLPPTAEVPDFTAPTPAPPEPMTLQGPGEAPVLPPAPKYNLDPEYDIAGDQAKIDANRNPAPVVLTPEQHAANARFKAAEKAKLDAEQQKLLHPNILGDAIEESLGQVEGHLTRPFNALGERFGDLSLTPAQLAAKVARMPPAERERYLSASGTADEVASNVLGAGLTVVAPGLATGFAGLQTLQQNAQEEGAPDWQKGAAATLNAPLDALHTVVGKPVKYVTGSDFLANVAELLAAHKITQETANQLTLRRMGPADTEALAARAPRPQVQAPPPKPVEPPIEFEGMPNDARLVNPPVTRGVRVPPEPATGGPPVAGRLPTSAEPAALPEEVKQTNYPGVIVPKPEATTDAQTAPGAAPPVAAKASMRFGGKKPVVGTPTVETAPTPGEGVTPSQVLPPAPPSTPIVGGVADLGGKGSKATETAVGRMRFGKAPVRGAEIAEPPRAPEPSSTRSPEPEPTPPAPVAEPATPRAAERSSTSVSEPAAPVAEVPPAPETSPAPRMPAEPAAGAAEVPVEKPSGVRTEEQSNRAASAEVDRVLDEGANLPKAGARSKTFGGPEPTPFHPDESPQGVFYKEKVLPDGSRVREMRMRTEDVNVDAERFQHKETAGDKGLTERLKSAKKWEEPTEPLSVWQDPADGKTYVVNGHQRMGVAERTGQPDVPVKFIDAPDAAAARLEGAKENLRSGHASAADVARFFREHKLDPDAADSYLKDIGAQDTAAGIREGRALAALPESSWNAYRHGEFGADAVRNENRAVALGNAIRNNGLDESLATHLSNKTKVANQDLDAWARRLKLSATSDKAQAGMFGDLAVDEKLLDVEATLQRELLDNLSLHRRQFGGVTAHAEQIEAAGIGKVDKAKAMELVRKSKTNFGKVVGLLKLPGGGPIDAFIREAAAREHNGTISHEKAFEELRNRTNDFIKSGAADAEPETAPEPKGPSLFGGEEPPPTSPPFGRRGESGSVGNVRPGGGVPDKPISLVTKAIEKPWQKGVEKVSDLIGRGLGKVEVSVPGMKYPFQAARWARGMFTESRQKIGPEYAQTMESGEGNQRLERAKGEYIGRHLGDAIAQLPGDAKDAVYRFLGGESDTLPADLSPEAKDLVDRGVALVNEGRDALVTLGRSSPEARAEYQRYLVRQMQNVELAKAYARGEKGQPETTGSRPRLPERFSRQDAYELHVDLPRRSVEEQLSEAKMPPSYIGEMNGTTLVKFPDSAAGKIARDAFAEHLVEVHAKARQDLNRLSTNEFTGKTPGTRAEPNRGPANPSVGQGKMLYKASLDVPRASDLRIRTADPLSPEMRELMGEDRSPATALARTIANVRGEVAKTEMLNSVLRGKDAEGEWAIEMKPGEKASDAPEGYQHVSNKRLGPLDDVFLRNDIAKDIKGTFGIGKPADQRTGWDRTGDVMRGATDSWKGWRTVRNPAGHVQNAISGPMTAIEAGISPFNPENLTHFADTLEAMKEPNPFDPMQAEIIRNGIDEGAHLSSYELGKVRDTWRDPGTSMSYKVGKTITDPFWWTKKAQDFDQAAGRSYNFVDRLIRQSLYRKLRAEGLSESEATLETDKFTTNYAKQGSFVKGARHMPFSPFITYAYERLRILKNNLAEHPTRAAASLAAGYALQQAIEATLGSGVSDEEKKAAHEQYGNSRFGGLGNQFAVVSGRHADGSPIIWDTGSLFTIDRPLRGPQDNLDQSDLVSNGKWLLGDTLGLTSGPILEQMISQISGRDYQTGKEFLDLGERAKSMGASLLPPLTPGIGVKAEKIRKSFGGEQYAKTKPAISGTEALLDALLHIRVDGYAPAQSIQNALWELNRAEQPIEERFNRDVTKDPEGASKTYAEELPALYKRFGKKIESHAAAAGKTPEAMK